MADMKLLKITVSLLLALILLASGVACSEISSGFSGDISVNTENANNVMRPDISGNSNGSINPDDRYDGEWITPDDGNGDTVPQGPFVPINPDKPYIPDGNIENEYIDGSINKLPGEVVDFDEGFEGDIVIGSKYFDGSNLANINNDMHFLHTDGNKFTLNSIEVGAGFSGGIQYYGTFVVDEVSGIYTLTFDDGNVAYGRSNEGMFLYCKKDGSDIETVSGRGGDGVTDTSVSVRQGNTDYGYKDLAKNRKGDKMQELYRDLLEIYEEFYGSERNISAVDGRYELARIELSPYGLTIDEAVSVWKIFGLDNPAYYYFYNTLSVEGDRFVLCVDSDYATAQARRAYEADIADMAEECAELLKGKKTELLRAMAVHDYIISEINYAYESDGKTPEDASWAHNIIGVSSKKSGVCESYAKAFQYLCGVNGIDSVILTGYGGEPHAWNLVRVDGKWYGVDATWDDTGDNSRLSYDCFGLSFSNMTASHKHDMPNDFGTAYLYDIPTVSNTDIQLVTLYEDGNDLGLFSSIDSAFARMTDADAEYTVELFDYSNVGPLLLSSPRIKHYVFAKKTPDVKSISIEGEYKQSEGGFITIIPIYLVHPAGLTVTSDLTITDMEFFQVDFFCFPGLFLDNSRLTFSGGCCESEISKIGRTENDTTSTIVSNSNLINIYSEVDVHRIEGGPIFEGEYAQSNITLRGNVTVDEVELSILNLTGFGNFEANIGKFIGVGDYPTIGFDSVKAVIGDIAVEDGIESISFSMRFGKLEEVSVIKLTGSVNAKINLTVDGEKDIHSTDLNGNIIDIWTEAVDPMDIDFPFLILNEKIDFGDVKIDFIIWDNGGHSVEKTELYKINEKYEIILK